MNSPNSHESSSSPPPPLTDSVLQNLETRYGEASRILLPDSAGEESPLIAPGTGQEGTVPAQRGSYQVLGEIARGGVGVILKGHDPDLGRDVAMKTLRDEHKDNPALLQRFVEEAQISGQLQHPGIAPVYEMGLREDQSPYFTMKLIKGRTFSALLDDRDDPAGERHRFLRIFEQVCQTMAYAHSRGVIHRDLKPANIMVGAFGEVQVMDWGFAKVLARGGVDDEKRALARESIESVIQTVRSGPGSSTQSLAGSVMGTPSNMPPEQARGEIEKTDERSDVFALGGILCEVLTGRSLYGGEEDPIVAAAECRLDATHARLDACGAHPELIQLCKSCLAPAMAARPRNAEVLSRRLHDHLTGVEERAREAELRATRARGRQRLTLALSTFVLLAAVAGGGGYFWVEQQAASHRETLETAIGAAMTEAGTAYGLAQGDDSGDMTHWDDALAALDRVQPMVEDPDSSPTTRAQAASFRGEIESHRAAAVERLRIRAHHAEFLAQLDEILYGSRQGPDQNVQAKYSNWACEQYARIFAEFGLDIDSMTTDAACESIADHALSFELAGVLDHWSRLARISTEEDDWRKFMEVAQAADPDEERNVVRDAVLGQDVDALLELAADPAVLELPPATLTLLGNSLFSEGRFSEALALMRGAYARHADDLPIIGWLAVVLKADSLTRQDAVPYWSALVALRPQSLGARIELADLYLELGWKEDAIAMARSAVELAPDNAYAYSKCFEVLVRFGEAREALAIIHKEQEFEGKTPGNLLGGALALNFLGERDQAREWLDRFLEVSDLDNLRDLAIFGLLDRASYAMAEEDWPTALEWLAKSSSYQGTYSIGLIHLVLGDREEARFQIRSVLTDAESKIQRDPGSNLIRTGLALWLALCPLEEFRDPAKSLAYAEEALRRGPNRSLTWAALAAARLANEDYAGTRRACGEARNAPLEPLEGRPLVLLLQCMAEWHMGDHEAAHRSFAQSEEERRTKVTTTNEQAELMARFVREDAAKLLGLPQ